jgi:hypothetical protein
MPLVLPPLTQAHPTHLLHHYTSTSRTPPPFLIPFQPPLPPLMSRPLSFSLELSPATSC